MADKKIELQLKCENELLTGNHATDAIITISDKDVCLNFVVPGLVPGEMIITSRMFLPHSTALQMAGIIQQRLKPADDLLQKLKGLIPPSEDSAGPQKQ